MNFVTKQITTLAIAGLLTAASLASAAFGKDAKQPNFVDPALLDLTTLMVPPPSNDSAQTKSELAEIHALQQAATPERMQQAVADHEETVWEVVGANLGPAFTADKLPLTAAFFQRVLSDEGTVVDPAKEKFGRPRPPLVDKDITPCGGKMKETGAYPSGHATVGYLTMIVLGDMLPEKRDVIQAGAKRFAESRVICGVHYRSDVEASKTVAALMAVQMRANPAFRKEFAAARNELRAVLDLNIKTSTR